MIGWADELRLGLIGRTRRVWAPVGVKVVQPLHYERQWCSLVLVVDPRAGRLWWSWTLDMTASGIAAAVALWREAGIDAAIWDRAPAHQTAAVHQEGVTLVPQPPYSPGRNPAERIFEAARLHIEGLVSTGLPEKYAAVHAFLTDLEADPIVSAPSPAGSGSPMPSPNYQHLNRMRRSHARLVLGDLIHDIKEDIMEKTSRLMNTAT